MIFFNLFLTIRAALTRFWGPGCNARLRFTKLGMVLLAYALQNWVWLLLVYALLSDLIKNRPDDNLPYLPTF
jgi:hypothetical protein